MATTIGVMGSNQIQHVIPILEQKYNVINLQEFLDEKGKLKSIVKWIINVMKVDCVYNIYTSQYVWKKAIICKLLGKRFITHWIGTDAYVALKENLRIDKNISYHFACFDSIQDELNTLSVTSEILPIFPYKMNLDLVEMPGKHACLIYMPTGKEFFYGYDMLEEVFIRYSDLDFYIVGNTDIAFFEKYSNVHVLGVLSLEEMNEVYKKISIVIRVPRHDGLSMSVIEALAKGKYVLWNYKYPFSRHVRNGEDIIQELGSILNEIPQINKAGHDYVNKTYTSENFLRIFKHSLEGE